MADAEFWAGVDLGATWVRVVLSDEKGNFVDKISERVDLSSSDAISKQISRLVKFLSRRQGFDFSSLKGVGVASAGPLIQGKGVLVSPPNLPFDYVPLTKPIGKELHIRAYLVNDCVGAVLGEHTFGAAKGLDNHVYITLSTGIGGGAIVNGTLLLGKDGNGHEIGHLVIDCEGRLICGCGKRGHWEAYCSGRNIPNFVRLRLKDLSVKEFAKSLLFEKVGGDLSKLDTKDLFSAAKEGDDLSRKLIDEIGVLNAMGFASVINVYDPSLITVGGAVALKNKQMILGSIKRHVENYTVNRVPKIMATPLGEDVVLYGAIAVALRYLS